MKVLVVGQGGREHALAWKLAQSPRVDSVFVAPGNAGTRQCALNVPFAITDVEGITSWAVGEAVDLTVVGPEAALASGLVDALRAKGLRVFGPSRQAAQIESSKQWAKAFMVRHGIPTAPFQQFSTAGKALEYLDALADDAYPVVVKADGLMAGKGVTIAQNREEAVSALQRLAASTGTESVVIEQFLTGYEASFLAVCDGSVARPLALAHDYKRAGNGDTGPMTGGMGAFSPLGLDAALNEQIVQTVIAPAMRGLAEEGAPFIGVLYAGIMLTDRGPFVLEFNARFGDPETQVLLPRWQDDLFEVLCAAADGRLAELPTFSWTSDAACGVVIAAQGYPDTPRGGDSIGGLERAAQTALVFHCGTKESQDEVPVSSGGRVLTIVGMGTTLDAARSTAYEAAEAIDMTGGWYRADIAVAGLPHASVSSAPLSSDAGTGK